MSTRPCQSLLYISKFLFNSKFLQSKMSSSCRPSVYISGNPNGTDFKHVSFEKCLLTSMGCKGDRMQVGYSYENSKLEIYPSQSGVRLQHPPGCPCRFLTPTDITQIPQEVTTGGLDVSVCLLLQSSDDKVLITRRSKNLRTFPSVWVLPGGHVEPGETIQQAAVREFTEETGLKTGEGMVFETLGLWEKEGKAPQHQGSATGTVSPVSTRPFSGAPKECFEASVFPQLLSYSLPKRHHCVIYLSLHVNNDHVTLQENLQLDPVEVDAAAWLDQMTVGEIVKSDDYGSNIKTPQRYLSAVVLENNHHILRKIPLTTFMTSVPPTSGPDVERLSAGTKFALRQWLKLLYPPPPGSLQKADSLETVFHTLTKAGHQPNPSPFWAR